MDLRSSIDSIDPAELVGNAAVSALRTQLFQKLSGLNVLQEKDGTVGINANDVLVNQQSNFVEFEISIGGTVQANDLAFDMNLPGLGLKVDGNPTLSLLANWKMDIGIGIDKNSGVYIKLNPSKTDDLHIDFLASLQGGTLNAKLGFLNVTVANNKTEAAAEFDIDLNPGSDGRISLGEIFSVPLTTAFTGNVHEAANAGGGVLRSGWMG